MFALGLMIPGDMGFQLATQTKNEPAPKSSLIDLDGRDEKI